MNQAKTTKLLDWFRSSSAEEVRGGPRPPVGRILWNAGGDTVDEIVLHDCMVHIEQMSDGHYYVGITDRQGNNFTGNIGARGRGKVDFTITDSSVNWDEDEEHTG